MASTNLPAPGAKLPQETVPAACLFGKSRLVPLLEAFDMERDGVREGKDIEYIHRMRVASRRLRAALPLFERCFLKKQFTRWSDEIRTITRALGDARDCDVQIAYLVKYQKRSEKAWKAKKNESGEESPTTPAVRYLVADLQKRRNLLQKEVLGALEALDKSHAIDGMRTAFAPPVHTVRSGRKHAFAYGIAPLAALRIEQRLRTLLSFEPWVSHPDAVAEHHATRIAAKKLRYTLEVYAPVYRLSLKKPLARVKTVQEILGDLHDCDVWIDTVTRLLLRERSRLRSDNEEKRPDTSTLAALKLFLAEREKERTILYRKFVRYWSSLHRAHIWDDLRSTLVNGRKAGFKPHETLPEPEIRSGVAMMAAEYPEGINHSLQVTRLALQLFDHLEPVHHLDARDRFLLECACMLHDRGLKEGQKNHNIRSAALIFADEQLPLDLEERGMVALAALAHRGNTTIESHGFYPLLSPADREKIHLIAGILRIADGLDYPHQGAVQEIVCTMGDTIFLDVTGLSDLSAEKEHARAKSDVFIRASGRTVVIR